jgi:eukaryotic-like serine/threonine-protein kinase
MKRYCRLTLLISLAVLYSGVIAAQQSTESPPSDPRATVAIWSQYGFLASHSSFNNREHTLSRANVSGLTLQWAGEVGPSAASAPIVGQGIVYVAADGMIFAFLAGDGTPLWSHLSCGGLNTVEAALGPQALLVGDGGGDLAAYDPATGNQMWCLDEGGSITSAPAVDASTVYITNGASVVAVDQLTGTQRWSFTPSDLTPMTNTPAVLNQTVYVTGGNSVFALAGATGQQLWRTDLEAQFVTISAPSAAEETVYVGGNQLYALGAADGGRLWTQSMAGVGVSTPAIAHNKLFVNSLDPHFGLWAFRADNGAFLWHNATPEESSSTLTVANGVVFDIAAAGGLAGVGGLMMFNSETGALLGSIVDPDGHPFNKLPGSQPAVVGGTVYISTSDGSGSNRVDAFRLP